MRQIGARQEAGRIGGIGACGRELCCSTWITNFVSVTTNAARYQEVSLNPQKLAGQCSKLKCCINYEVDAYMDARKDFPNVDIPLETMEGTAYHQKTDIFKGVMWYSSSPDSSANLAAVPIDRVKDIIKRNKKGNKPSKLVHIDLGLVEEKMGFQNVVGQESLTRFEDKKPKPKRKKKRRPSNQSSDRPSGGSNRPKAKVSDEKSTDGTKTTENRPQNRDENKQGGKKNWNRNRRKPRNNESKE